MIRSCRPDSIFCDDYANLDKGVLNVNQKKYNAPMNGVLKVTLQLEGMTVKREEVIDLNTEEMLELNGLRKELSLYDFGTAWSKETREKYRRLQSARAAFAKEVSDEVASAIISAFECTDHKLVQPEDLELKYED